MSLDTTDTGFEALRGTMLTDAGMDGLQEFEAFHPDFLVVEKGFTPECPDIVARVADTFCESTAEETKLVTSLVTYLGSLSRQGINHPLYVQGSWDENQPGIETHLDYKHGHTFLGMFGVEGSPALHLYTSRTSRPLDWRTNARAVSHAVSISPEDPLTIPLSNEQLIMINGSAVRAWMRIGEKVSDGRASLPHAVEVGPGNKRSRLMIYAGTFRPIKQSYLPGSDLSRPVEYRPQPNP